MRFVPQESRTSAPHGLCEARAKRGVLKLLLRKGGILAWGETGHSPSVSKCFRNPLCYLFVIYPAAPLLSPSSDQERNSVFPLPMGFPFCISSERRNFQLHGSGKDDEFILWIASYWMYLRFQGKIKPDTPGNESNILLWGNVQLETLLWSPLESEPGGSSGDVLLSHLEKDRGWMTMRHSLLWHKLQLYQE